MTLVVVSGLLVAAALLLLVPATVYLVQVIASRGGWPETAPVPTGARPSIAVLMPAHDEAGGIADSIRVLLSQLGPKDRLLVVADNCGDETAAVARASGAEVTIRVDPARRGKGYALDHGLRHLAAAPPEIVVIVDADCIVAANALDLLTRECARAQRPVQALYLMHAPAGAGLRQRIAEFAWSVRNRVRPLGSHRLGFPCQLMGTGMAFPWPLICTASLASGSIVEDMQLGLDLAAGGVPPRFCPAALVTSTFPQTSEGSLAQRTRWEHGHLAMIGSNAVPLLWRGLAQRRLDLVAMALDLCVPPLAALVLLMTGLALAGALLAAFGGALLPLALAVVGLMLTMLATALAWQQVGRPILSWLELLSAPGYALAKIPIYLRVVTARQRDWIRTRRDAGHR